MSAGRGGSPFSSWARVQRQKSPREHGAGVNPGLLKEWQIAEAWEPPSLAPGGGSAIIYWGAARRKGGIDLDRLARRLDWTARHLASAEMEIRVC